MNSRRSAAILLLVVVLVRPFRLGALTLLRLVDELNAVLEELARHVEDLLHLVRHGG